MTSEEQTALIGQTVNQLLVLRPVGGGYLECRCACGTLTIVQRTHIATGTRKSCGTCLPTGRKNRNIHICAYCGQEIELAREQYVFLATGNGYHTVCLERRREERRSSQDKIKHPWPQRDRPMYWLVRPADVDTCIECGRPIQPGNCPWCRACAALKIQRPMLVA